MKILITGKNSYIGNSVEKYLQKKGNDFFIEQLDMQGDKWKKYNFSSCDVVLHVAGLAHRKITKDKETYYFKVNRDLAAEAAEKAITEGVHHFIFVSTMSVYSEKDAHITKKTLTSPDNVYGLSKLQAEDKIKELSDESDCIISIIRPPMIYGKGCKGNYNSLRKIALTFPVFPKIKNKKSMLYIDNLSELIYQIICSKASGTYYPQNKELVNTSEWASLIAKENGCNLHLSRFLGWCVILGKYIPGLRGYCIKAFNDSYYEPSMSIYKNMNYQRVSFKESIKLSEER